MDVKPLHAVLAVLVFGTLLVVAGYSGLQAQSVPGPSDLQLDRNGDLHVRIGQRLFVYDKQGDLREHYSLDEFQVSGLVGSFGFFPDNSLLLVPENGGAGSGRLQRCYRDSATCTLLPRMTTVFDQSFRVAIDDSATIYLAHTARKRVYQLAEDGAQLHRLPGKFQRPHRLRLVAGDLAIADTGAHELVVVPLSGEGSADDGFAGGEDWRHLLVESPPGVSMKSNLPLDFVASQGQWWVLATPVDRSRVALYRYDEDGAYLSSIALPAGSDPMAIALLGEDIAVADYRGFRVYLYRADGKPAGELTSPEQAAHVELLRQRQGIYRAVQYLAWGLFALALVAGFVIAIKGEMQKARKKKAEAEAQVSRSAGPDTPRPHHLEARVHWLEASKKPLWLMVVVGLLLVAMPVTITVGMPQPEDAKEICTRFTIDVTVWAMTGLLLVIIVPIGWKLRQVVATRIGIADEWVLVDRGNGPVLVARDEDLLRVANGFMIDGITIPTGSPQMSLFDRKELEQWLQPRLDRGQSLGPIRQLGWQWRHQRGMFVLTWTLVALGLVVVLGMELGWFEGWFEQWLKTQPACAEVLAEKASATPG